jgi:hypothetical protein
VRASLGAFASAPPSGDALAKLRRRTAGNWPLTIETLGQLLSTWLAGDAAGAARGVPGRGPRIARLGHTRSGRPSLGTGVTVLLAGPAERMKRSLSVVGRVDTVTISSEAAAVEAGVQVSPEQRKRGRQLVDAAVVAHGGAAKLKAVRNSFTTANCTCRREGATSRARCGSCARTRPARLHHALPRLRASPGPGWPPRLVAVHGRGLGDGDGRRHDDALGLRAILASDLVHLLREASDPASDPISQGAAEVAGKPWIAWISCRRTTAARGSRSTGPAGVS